jgi:hypothetical protein
MQINKGNGKMNKDNGEDDGSITKVFLLAEASIGCQ